MLELMPAVDAADGIAVRVGKGWTPVGYSEESKQGFSHKLFMACLPHKRPK